MLNENRESHNADSDILHPTDGDASEFANGVEDYQCEQDYLRPGDLVAFKL